MARQAVAGAATQPRKKPESARRPAGRGLNAVAPPARRRLHPAFVALLATTALAVCAAIGVLHVLQVQNQAGLDSTRQENELRRERIEALQVELAYLDSPEGLADQARNAGLVPAVELVTLTAIAPGMLAPPNSNPFALAGLRSLVADPEPGADASTEADTNAGAVANQGAAPTQTQQVLEEVGGGR